MLKQFPQLIISLTFCLFIGLGEAQTPQIVKQPTNQSVIEGKSVIFKVEALGEDLKFQWYKNDIEIKGANNTDYIISKSSIADSKSQYKCVVSNTYGTEISLTASLYVKRIGSRVLDGMQILYDFDEAGGDIVFDNSGIEPPYNLLIDNPSAATWTPFGLGVNDKVYMNENPPITKLIDSCKSTNEITIEVWIKPAYATQLGGSRIVTLSPNAQNCNFSLVQNDKNFGLRLRTTTTTNRGEPALLTAFGTATDRLTHLVCTRSSDGIAKIYQNGIEITSGIFSGDFSNWDPTYRFQIGNEFINPREWLGTFYLVAIYNRALSLAEVLQNYNAGVEVDHKPEIIIEPADQGLLVGGKAVFKVNAVGDEVLEYQWKKNGVDILNAKEPEYTIPSVSLSDNGDIYSCLVTNSLGSDLSRNARLSVTDLNSRVTAGQIVYYNFQEGTGDTIRDNSGNGNPLDLIIHSPNSVKWKPYGLLVDSVANINSGSNALKVNNAAIANGEFTVELWMKQMQQTQFPATIFSLSSNSNERRNFSLIQQDGLLETRLRYLISPLTGLVIFETPNTIFADSLVHIVFMRSTKERSKLFINGLEAMSAYQVKGNLSNWSTGFSLKLANEIFASQPWKGLFNLVSIYDRALDSIEIQQNYRMGPVGKIEITAPLNLTANAEEPGKVKLTWGDGSDNEDGFIVERKEIGLNFEIVDSVSANELTYFDFTVKDTTKYYYRIKGYNFVKQSVYSNEVEVTTMLTGIDDNNVSSAVLNDYKLEQNYPNPFNPITKIQFSIPKSQFVNMKVFNSIGCEIVTLINEVKEVGIHSIEFDANELPSGVYFYRLHAGSFVDYKKMLLLK